MKFKIEYDPRYLPKYIVYRLENQWWKFIDWKEIASFEKEEDAIASLEILKKFPKYMEY